MSARRRAAVARRASASVACPRGCFLVRAAFLLLLLFFAIAGAPGAASDAPAEPGGRPSGLALVDADGAAANQAPAEPDRTAVRPVEQTPREASRPAAGAASPLATSGEPRPEPADAAFEQANVDFAAGRYPEAAERLERIATQHGWSAALLFNLGNASFRAGQIGQAVLAYERARLLAPRDPDLAANLRQVRRAASLALPEPTLWERFVEPLTGDGWALLASASLVLACVLALGTAALRRTPRPLLPRALAATATVAASMALLAGFACATAIAQARRGVVLAAEPTLRVAPYPTASASQRLAPGEIVELGREHAGFVLIRAHDGRSGWIAASEVGRIADLPPSAGT